MQNKVSKDYFHLKGKTAEKLVYDLAKKTFLIDWCYLNPLLPNKNELCDLLVVFDDIGIIWQIKDLKLGKNNRYKKSKVQKNLSQLSGAYRQLFDLNTELDLKNPHRGVEMFNPGSVKQVYLISALLGKGEAFFSPMENFNGRLVHVFSKESVEIILNELDTISDFIDYLRIRQELFEQKKSVVVLGGEKELLAFYLMNNRSFNRLLGATNLVIDEGSWEELQKKPEYKAKKREDEISYCWDNMIQDIHRGSTAEYEILARELAQLNRFQRRCLSKYFFDAHVKSHNDRKNNVFRRAFQYGNITYCFLYYDDPEPKKRERRKNMLADFCLVARGKYKRNNKVIGIATEKKIRPESSYDYCLLDKPEWTKEDQRNMENYQKKTGVLTNSELIQVHEDEYPRINNKRKP